MNGPPRSNGETEIERRERHAGEAGHSAGRWIERPAIHKLLQRFSACDCGGALSNPHEAHHRHGTSVRAPLLRVSVSIRFLRPLRYLRLMQDSGDTFCRA